jgi:hypothetical protein
MLIPSLLGENLVRNRRELLNMLQSVGNKKKTEESYADSCVAGENLRGVWECCSYSTGNKYLGNRENRRFIC